MTGLATFMAGGAAPEVTAAFKEAFFRYNTGPAFRYFVGLHIYYKCRAAPPPGIRQLTLLPGSWSGNILPCARPPWFKLWTPG